MMGYFTKAMLSQFKRIRDGVQWHPLIAIFCVILWLCGRETGEPGSWLTFGINVGHLLMKFADEEVGLRA
jgi:hypothetical protein